LTNLVDRFIKEKRARGILGRMTSTDVHELAAPLAATDADWAALVVHQAPLNTDCERAIVS
jgi:hypothetical protein